MQARRSFLARLAALAAFLALVPALAPRAQAQTSDLDPFIRRKMAEAHVPGVAACIVKEGRVAWAEGYGLRDVVGGLPVEPDTPFMLASISKAVTGTALMQLWDQGAFGLDDDVDAHLPFALDHPLYPQDRITFRQVLSHVASIRDNWGVMMSLVSRGDSPLPLGDFMQGYLEVGGTWYHPQKNFTPKAPGTGFEYSNIGFALAGYLTESIAAVPFDAWCEAAIFDPLGMDDTSWRIADFPPDTVAIPHRWDGPSASFVPYGHYGYPDYPNGCLRTSALDLAHFLLAHMNQGSWRGVQVLSPAATAEMHTVQYPALEPTQGLALYYWNYAGMQLLGHAGGDAGVYTEMWFRPDQDTGVILLSNGDPTKYSAMFQILKRLFAEAALL